MVWSLELLQNGIKLKIYMFVKIRYKIKYLYAVGSINIYDKGISMIKVLLWLI